MKIRSIAKALCAIAAGGTLAAALLLPLPEAVARRNRLNLKPSKSSAEAILPGRDSLDPSDGEAFDSIAAKVVFSGFDKTANSAKETFFITNNSHAVLLGLTVEISYLTTDGRCMHRRDEKIDMTLRPGDTRMATIRSFDSQKSFYYIKSNPPAKRSATPFSVRMKTIGLRVRS